MLFKKFLNHRDKVLFVLFLLFFTSIVFSLRGISSISIGLILLIALTGAEWNEFKREKANLFLAGCTLLFLLRCFTLLQTHNTKEGLAHLQRSSGLILIPLAVILCKYFLGQKRYQKLIYFLSGILFVASLTCILIAASRYIQTRSSGVFVFHELVKPIRQHAVQFSVYVFVVLLFLITELKNTTKKKLVYAAVFYFTIVLVLLASRLILCFYLLFVSYYFFKTKIENQRRRWALLFIGLVTVILGIVAIDPVRTRFADLFSGNQFLFTEKKFNPNVYLNGFQFRLLQWRLVPEILNEKHAWITGVSPGDAQSLLDKKYIDADLFTGPVGDYRQGYLGLHTHNEFLQVLLETGLIGLLIFLLTCLGLIRMAMNKRKTELSFFIALLLAYCFTDAVPETQYGLAIFTFFPVFLYLSAGRQKEANKNRIA